MAQSYRDLAVYRLAHRLGVESHRFSLRLPKFELYETGQQLRRASKSISANIVEGYGRRRYKADFIRFLGISHSSCDETIEWLEYVRECHPALADEALQLIADYKELGRSVYRFLEAVQSEHRT